MDLDNALVSVYGGNPKDFDPVVVMPLYRPVNQTAESSEENKKFGLPFIIAASAAGLFLLIALILLIALVAAKKKARGGSVNSAYEPVP